MKSRRANANVTYEGKNITADIKGDTMSVSYDEGFNRADSAEITIQDRSDKWLLRWKPQKEEVLKLNINVTNWKKEGDNRQLKCGIFLIDDIGYSGPPSVLSLKGNSMPSNSGFIGTPHSRTWNEITLKDQILSMMPEGLTLNWQTQFNIDLIYAEQSEMPDLEYISKQCQKYGLRLKVLNNQLVVFSARELDLTPPIRTFQKKGLAGYTLNTGSTRTNYDACTVKYQNAAQGQEITYTYPPSGAGGKVYEITETVYSIAEAEVVAKAALWTQNMQSDTAEITLPMGDPALFAGRNIELSGFGDFDGVYGIDASVHTLDASGYATSISLHKVIREVVTAQEEIKIGDTVNFSGGYHYVASTATEPTGGQRTAGTARVTNIAAGALHPYHLIGVLSNVYGWVDASTVSKG